MDLSKYTKPTLDKWLKDLNLTDDEFEIYKLLAKGKTVTEISLRIGLSVSSVARRIRKIKAKINDITNGSENL